MAKMALMPKSNVIASTNTSFAILDISVIIADEYGHQSGFFAVPAVPAAQDRLSFQRQLMTKKIVFQNFESQSAKLGCSSIFVLTISHNFLHSSIIYVSINFNMFLCLV